MNTGVPPLPHLPGLSGRGSPHPQGARSACPALVGTPALWDSPYQFLIQVPLLSGGRRWAASLPLQHVDLNLQLCANFDEAVGFISKGSQMGFAHLGVFGFDVLNG